MITFNSLVRRAKILNEANLYNDTDLTSAVMSVVGDASPVIQKWFRTKYIQWYKSTEGDFAKDTGPYNRKDSDPDWAKEKDSPHPQEREFSKLGSTWEPSKPAATSKGIVMFNSLTDEDINNIKEIKVFLGALPPDTVSKITYAEAIRGAKDNRNISITSPVWRDRVLKYYEEIDALLVRTGYEHLSNAKEWFRTIFMYWFFEECPHFNAETGLEPTWRDKIQHTMEYIGVQNTNDENYERDLLANGDPAVIVAEAEAESGRAPIESNIKPLTEGKDYVPINPLYNFDESKASESDLKQLTKFKSAMRNGRYKFIRLVSKQSFINEGERLKHCVKTDHYKFPKDHTLLSLWQGDNLRGDPQATMEFDNRGKDLIGKYDKAKFNIIGDERPGVKEDELQTMIQCKGKDNHAPQSDRVKFVLRKFVTLNKIDITQDGEKIGLKKWLSHFYDPDSPQWDKLMVDEIIPAQEKRFKEIRMRIIDADTGKQVYPNG